MDYILLGKRIRDERLLLRLTLEKLAEQIDKSINFLGQIERGEGKPSIETLIDIANALGTTIDYLLQDNLMIKDDNIVREINYLIHSIDYKEKIFILDMIKRYINHVNNT
jgi:transcriptional regulator with XRE-family HTH domain